LLFNSCSDHNNFTQDNINLINIFNNNNYYGKKIKTNGTSFRNVFNEIKEIDKYSAVVNTNKKGQIGLDIIYKNEKFWAIPLIGSQLYNSGIEYPIRLVSINNKILHKKSIDFISKILDKDDSLYKFTFLNYNGRLINRSIKPPFNEVYGFGLITNSKYNIYILPEIVQHHSSDKFISNYYVYSNNNKINIIDLRGSIGGDLNEAISIASIFVPKNQPIIKKIGINSKTKSIYSIVDLNFKKPDLILVDNRTSSSSEILARVIKYYNNTLIVGEKTFGKCLSQTVYTLSDDKRLILTTEEIQIASGISCENKPIKPDILIKDISLMSYPQIFNKINLKTLK